LPKVVTLHGVHGVHVAARRGPAAAALYRLAERYSLRRTDAILCVSPATLNHFQHCYPHLAGRLRMIPAGIDTRIFKVQNTQAARRLLGFPEDGKLIAFVGRFEPEKRPDWVLDEFRSLRRSHSDVRLVMIGEGSMAGALRGKLSTSGDPVSLQSSVPQDVLARYLGASDLLVVASRHEGLPTVALEAMACGTPVVAWPVGILPDIVKSRVNGFIAHSEHEFRALIEEALYETSWMREQCGASVAMFGWEKIAPAILEVYREISS